MYEEREEEWEGGDEGEEYVKRYQRAGKKDEPMSPLAVVCMSLLLSYPSPGSVVTASGGRTCIAA
jgi:hypothetical protein